MHVEETASVSSHFGTHSSVAPARGQRLEEVEYNDDHGIVRLVHMLFFIKDSSLSLK